MDTVLPHADKAVPNIGLLHITLYIGVYLKLLPRAETAAVALDPLAALVRAVLVVLLQREFAATQQLHGHVMHTMSVAPQCDVPATHVHDLELLQTTRGGSARVATHSIAVALDRTRARLLGVRVHAIRHACSIDGTTGETVASVSGLTHDAAALGPGGANHFRVFLENAALAELFGAAGRIPEAARGSTGGSATRNALGERAVLVRAELVVLAALQRDHHAGLQAVVAADFGTQIADLGTQMRTVQGVARGDEREQQDEDGRFLRDHDVEYV